MPDNTILNAGAGGDTIATDEIGAAKYQRVKITLGADGTNDGDVASGNPMPVDDAGGSLTVDNSTLAVVGGGVEATAMRVTLANDSTGLLSVDDNGGALTVDAANDGSLNVQIGDGTLTATVRDTGASDSLNVAIVDASGNQITSFGGSGGTSHSDDAAFTIGSASSITPMGALADETTPDSVDEGDAGLVRMTLDRKLLTRVVGASDADRLDINASGQAQVDIAADSVGLATSANQTSVIGTDGAAGPASALSIAGTDAAGDLYELLTDTDGHLQVDVLSGGGAGTEVTEDDAAAANPIGGMLMARRRDTPASETTADGDVTALNCTDEGSLHVELRTGGAELANGGGVESGALRVTVASDSTGVLSVDDNGGSLTVDGTVTANAGTGDFLSISAHTRNESFKESTAIGAELDDTGTTAATEGNVSPCRMTAQRALHVQLRGDGTTPLDIGAGSQSASTLRVTQADDDVLAVTDNGGSLTVDNATLSVTGGGVETGALRVTIANNSTGVLSVDDNGGSLTVDGTVTANAGTGDFLSISAHTRNEAFKESTAIGGELDDTATVAATEGNVSPTRITAQRALHVNLRNNSGTEIGSAASPVRTDPTGTTAQPVSGTVTASNTAGNVAHDGVDTGNPVKIGMVVREFASAPTTVSANGDRVNAIATPQGMQWVLGGHPNIISREFMTNDGETDTDMLGAVAAGSHVVLMGIECLVDAAVTATVQVRCGFGATTVPAEPATGAGVNGVVLSHPGLSAGSGVVRGNAGSVIGVGGDGEELRVTCGSPTGGQIQFIITYYVATL